MHSDDPRSEKELATDLILESISEGVFTVDHEWHITSFNRAAEEITGTPRDEALGRCCWEVFRSTMCEGDCALKRTMEDGHSIVSSSAWIINNEQQRVPIGVSTAVLRDSSGRVIGGVETFRDHSLVEELRRELRDVGRVGEMVSHSPAMARIFAILPQVAESESTVLVEGETGVGKEVLARSLHQLSRRAKQPFMAINCGALPDNLLESELFGYRAGAFTDAVKDKPGLFAAASGGTVLLDELGETSPAFQVKLLRVLEEKAYQPLGAVEQVPMDVRILAATNRDLAAMVSAGTFRRDLFYRINIIRFTLPPLRDRREDIPLLVERFIHRMNSRLDREIKGLTPEAMSLLLGHDYPGNIRELENIIERGFVLCREEEIDVAHLPPELREKSTAPASSGIRFAVHNSEAESIVTALERNGWNRLAAARALGVHKSTLFRKIRKYGIILPEKDGRNR
ncbi:sigma 54-interacting transcriptional regulator [Desulforhopalus vacuolatus]|nr:sigma 54-interacting transcriptional regulator [Desulforhopalus vacuolatus]